MFYENWDRVARDLLPDSLFYGKEQHVNTIRGQGNPESQAEKPRLRTVPSYLKMNKESGAGGSGCFIGILTNGR